MINTKSRQVSPASSADKTHLLSIFSTALICIISLLFLDCLKAKKSPFDINTPIGIFGSLFAISQSSGVGSVDTNNTTGIIVTVTSLYPVNGINWNDYINRDFSKDIFSQADTPCNTANTGGYKTCIHAGEIRKFDLPTRSSCVGLIATDNLLAMNWVCKANAKTGGVTFYSSALMKGKYLSDLIDWTTNAWKSLSITVKDGTTVLATSKSAKIWANVIDSSGTNAPNVTGSIYLYNLATLTNSISISANKISVLINPTGIKSIQTVGICNAIAGIDISNKVFIWLEGSFNFGNSSQNSYGVLLSASKFSVLKNVKIQNAGKNCALTGNKNNAIYLNTASNNYLEDVVLTQTLGSAPSTGDGLLFSSSDYNFVNGISVSNMATDGIQITSSKNNTILNATVISSAAQSVLVQTNSHNNAILNITAANTNNYGVRHVDSDSGLFLNVVVFNNQNRGVDLISGSSITIQNIAASNNPTAEISLNSVSSYFTGIIKTGGTNCTNTVSVGGLTAGCVSVIPSDIINSLNMTNISNTFVGSAAIDSKNSTNSLSGNANGVSLGSITDWVRFDHLYKGIGRFNPVAFPNTLHLGVCNSGNCTIWDFSLKNTDTVLRNGNTSNVACPNGSNMITHTFTNETITFLRNSVEFLNDGVGNDNGLCEANDDCFLTPNIGSYQGHGNIVTALSVSGCADVTDKGIKLYQYATNGY